MNGELLSTGTDARVRVEVVPSSDLAAQLPLVYQAPGTVSVTCLPHHGPARTVAASLELTRLGYHVVPHLAARSIASQTELHALLQQLQNAGIRELFLIAGDRRAPAGPYSWSGQLLEDVKAFSGESSTGAFSAGIAGYPEGHPQLSAQQLQSSLDTKEAMASSLVTQMCFSADTVARYLESLHRRGSRLPVWIGVPGAITMKKLLLMGARLGVGRSLKLARGTGMARALWRRSDFLDFDSDRLIRDIHRKLAGHPLFAGFHIYTFNDLGRLPGLLNGLPALDPPTMDPSALAPPGTANRSASPHHPAKI